MKSPKQTAKMQSTRFALFLGIVTTLTLAVGLSRPKTAEDDILPKLGLKSGELITIDQMGKGEMAITMNGQDYIIDYAVLSNRSKNFKLKVQSANGELVEQNAPPANTIRGTLRGVVGSRVVTGALLGDINLDGTVTVLLDAFDLIANLGQNVTSRSQGDLNADGLVEVLSDAFPLISQIGQSN